MARGEATTTLLPPRSDISQGIIEAIGIIEQITGRQFLAQGQLITPEEENGDGVDAFITTVSAGGPIQLVVLGAVSSTLEALAEQAVSGCMQKHTLSHHLHLLSPMPQLLSR